jgi:hypothetical protein
MSDSFQSRVFAVLNGTSSNEEKLAAMRDIMGSDMQSAMSSIPLQPVQGMPDLSSELDLLRMTQSADSTIVVHCSTALIYHYDDHTIQNFRSKQLQVIMNILSICLFLFYFYYCQFNVDS